MGVDIAGINPQTVGERPIEPDWNTATDHEKSLYFNELQSFHDNNPGTYFRSNWWGWRPIHAIADMAIKIAELPFNTNEWGENSGAGLDTQEECDALADAIEAFMILNNRNMHDEDDVFYLCLGSWTDSRGHFLDSKKIEKLNQEYPVGTILYRGVVDSEGDLVFPSHAAPLYHITNFITFLRKCGGFQIW